MGCVSALGAFHVNTASSASGSGLTPYLSTILSRFLIESLRISHFGGFHLNLALFMQPKTSSSRSMWSSKVCPCCYDRVVHVAYHKVPVLLGYSGQSLSHQSLKSGRGVAQAKGHPLPLVQPQFTCESGLFSVLLPQRDLPEDRTRVQCGEELGVAKIREALVYLRYRVRIFYCHCVQVTKVTTEPKVPHLLLGHATTPQHQGDFEGSIKSYSSNNSISAQHDSDL